MAFNSLAYLLFLPLAVLIYYACPGKIRPYLLLAFSYFFYAFADWRLSFLILLTTLTSYLGGLLVERCPKEWMRRLVLIVSVGFSLSVLFVFKYLNFVIASIDKIGSFFQQDLSIRTLDILLPVGISFYTFQTLSYVVDVYRKDVSPVRNFFHYALFVSFFPQLVAGPIERVDHLLPQLLEAKRFESQNLVKASRYLVMGYVKKIVIADILSVFVDSVFASLSLASGASILVAVLFFYAQIYADFSGYCDIAKGSAYLFSIELMDNFDKPYLSSSMAEFFRRWHVSLDLWFRDYLYVPLGGNRKGKFRQILAVLLVFFCSGLWHGADWTFVIWGLYCGFIVALEILFGHRRRNPYLFVPLTFLLVTVSWIFFRCQSIEDIGTCFVRIFTSFTKGSGFEAFQNTSYLIFALLSLFLLPFVDSLPRLADAKGELSVSSLALYTGLIALVVVSGFYLAKSDYGGGFIYFQF